MQNIILYAAEQKHKIIYRLVIKIANITFVINSQHGQQYPGISFTVIKIANITFVINSQPSSVQWIPIFTVIKIANITFVINSQPEIICSAVSSYCNKNR